MTMLEYVEPLRHSSVAQILQTTCFNLMKILNKHKTPRNNALNVYLLQRYGGRLVPYKREDFEVKLHFFTSDTISIDTYNN